MPGPGNKSKTRGKGKQLHGPQRPQKDISGDSEPAECLTLEEDEMTRCGKPLSKGHPRCKIHHDQYVTMYKRYKDASKVVDEIKQGQELPTIEQISRYGDWHTPLDKARWVRRYLEAIREERAGRDLHSRRFFLKVDDGHKMRLKLLHKEMVKAVETLDRLQARAYELYTSISPASDFLQSDKVLYVPRSSEDVIQLTQSVDRVHTLVTKEGRKLIGPPALPETGDEDLIDIELRKRKRSLLAAFEIFMEPDPNKIKQILSLADDADLDEVRLCLLIHQQYALRIVFYEPSLFMKSFEKVSLKDLILSDDFTIEDALRFFDLWKGIMGFGLKWCKDAVVDALAIHHHGTAANVGSAKDRFKILGGWIFNRAHSKTISNEAWFYLLKILQPPADVENRFVRLCNNFDDLVGLVSFGALGLYPTPSFCKDTLSALSPGLSRSHLSLCGVIVTDMISTFAPDMPNPIPTTRKAKIYGYTVWAETEIRAYMFGAIRNEEDEFTRAFLGELRARPDLFQVITRSETDPGQVVEAFGAGQGEALPNMRYRTFEAPPAPLSNPPQGHGDWEVRRSAHDVLYGTGREIQGYLTKLARDEKGWFFRFKTFPVKYFVILDTVPKRDHGHLARNVAWAALRAKGYGEGEYTLRKYAIASDKLFQNCAEDRLGWMPKGSWGMTKMEDSL